MTTTEGNKLIAEFMGLTHLNNQTRIETLKYHSSWDWLMSVVERIEEDGDVMCIMIGDFVAIAPVKGNEFAIKDNTRISGHSKIDAVWTVCIEYIQWYNQNK